MASVVPRKNKDGEITSYQVKWRLGGARDGDWQTERFDDDTAAKIFKAAVDEAGQQWPLGWVKGKGYITAGEDDGAAETPTDERFRFRNYALESIRQRTGAESRYRDACVTELETYIFPTFGECDIRSTDHFSKATIASWIQLMKETKVLRGATRAPMSPKTLKNLHGLLSSILKAATLEEPPLRLRNPCELSSLPRTDDQGVEDEDDEDMEFLEPDEVEGIVSCLERPEDQRLVRFAYATGLRWGELTALARRHLDGSEPRKRRVRVARAWKRDKERGYYLGKPKTKRSRRTLRISPSTWQDAVDQGAGSGPSSALLFHNGKGERLPYSTFYDRWVLAVKRAKELGLVPDYKFPTLHDLRHSHAAALISRGHSLTYVQRRLGHESITTTSDRYGHLLEEADDAAMETIEASLGARPALDESAAPAPARGSDQTVYAAHLGSCVVGFWELEHAEETTRRWAADRGEPVRVERWSGDWWIRSVGGGLQGVRTAVPDRAWIWRMGPVVYAADGTERVADQDVHEPRGRWVWEWEPGYTPEPVQARAEWVRGAAAETEAEAWGQAEDAVRGAFSRARADALRICGLNPARTGASEAERAV